MVIILNGMVSTRKHYIACSIADSYINKNVVKSEGLTFKMHLDPIEVYKGDELVYRPNVAHMGEDNGIPSLILGDVEGFTAQQGQDALDTAALLYKRGGVKTHTNHYFDNIHEDTQAGPTPAETVDEDYDTDWASMMKEFDSKAVNVITGVFSPFYINKLKSEYVGDVKVYNILRNPSVSYMVDDSYLEYSAKDTQGFVVDLQSVGGMLFSSIVNSCLVSKMSGVDNVKFEDIISSGVINIEGKEIPVGEFEDFNGTITKFEKDNLSTIIDEEKQLNISKFNDIFRNLNKIHPNLPNDVFSELNYEPIDYSTATGSPS